MFVGATAINLLSAWLCTYLLHRRRSGVAFIVGIILVVMLLWGLGSALLVQVWNPYLALLPYLAFLLSLWGLTENDGRLLPITIALASVIIQMHVAYLPIALAGLLCAVVAILLRSKPTFACVRHFLLSPPFLVAVAVSVILWVPPVLDQLFGTGNLRRVGSYFKDGQSGNVGLRYGFGLISDHIGIHGPWSGGHERVIFGNVQSGSLVPLALMLAALAGISGALVKQKKNPGLQILAITQVLIGGIAASKVQLPLLSYLIVWMLPLAAFCWIALLIGAIDCLSEFRAVLLTPVVALGLSVCLIAVGGIEIVRLTRSMSRVQLPRQEYATPVSYILKQMPSVHGKSIRVEGVGDDLNEAWVGVLYGLSKETDRFYTVDGAAGQKWGLQHRWKNQRVDENYTVAVTEPFNYADPVRLCRADPEQRQVASWDQLSDSERTELRRLLVLNFNAGGHLDKANNTRLNQLASRAFRISVFAGPRLCGGAPSD